MTSASLTTTSTTLVPVVTIKDGKVFANSRDVADFFEKEHKNVLRDILSILDSGVVERPTPGQLKSEPTSCWFIPSKYLDCWNRQQISYDMTRDGFTLLVMGYTGKTAMDFKVRYIQRFNEMEATLRNQAPAQAALPTSYKEALLALVAAEEVKERLIAANEQQTKVITDMTPKVNAWDKLVAADGCICSADLGPP